MVRRNRLGNACSGRETHPLHVLDSSSPRKTGSRSTSTSSRVSTPRCRALSPGLTGFCAFAEGVIVVEKDNFKPTHDEIDVPNLEVMNLMKSFKSRELVRETYNWLYSYYYLTNKGIEYLREYL